MLFVLFFLLSWLSGLLTVLLVAFITYEQFSIIDITSFAVFLFIGSLLLIPIVYYPLLKWLGRKIGVNKMIGYPLLLVFLANLPVYYIIWLKEGDLYGKDEAFLFFLAFIVTGLVFGMASAWKKLKVEG